MATRKGATLEELVREYLDRQGLFAMRSISLRFEHEEVTDIDVWCYGRQSASIRTRTLVDVKSKRSPKAFERIIWTRGMQLALGCDKAIVVTTDRNPNIASFAHQQKVTIIRKGFLDRLQRKIDTSDRQTLEQFQENIRKYPDHKQDGDWLRRISDAKSAVISLQGFPAFNKSMVSFRFFANRVQTRPQHREQTMRASYLTAALACIALDAALVRVLNEDADTRFNAIAAGVAYGDPTVQKNIQSVLSLIEQGMENGRVAARQAKAAIDKQIGGVRSDIIAEYFTKENNATTLVAVARELDNLAHCVDSSRMSDLSVEAKSVLGIFSDFVQSDRAMLLGKPQSTTPFQPEPTKCDSGEDHSKESGGGTFEQEQFKLL